MLGFYQVINQVLRIAKVVVKTDIKNGHISLSLR